MKPYKVLTSMSPYLITEEKRYILNFWPLQGRNRDSEQICSLMWTMWKWIGEFLSKFQGRGMKIARVNSIRVAKP